MSNLSQFSLWSNIVMIGCKHVFCKGCLESYLTNCDKSCPICRQEVDVKYVLCEK